MDKLNNTRTADDELLSQVINFLRFPLIMCVLYIHSDGGGHVVINSQSAVIGSYPIYTNLHFLISNILCSIAVPLFFIISGYLFFRNIAQFNISVYRSKIKKRVRTLFIPYIFWNALVILLFFLMQTFIPEFASGRNKLIANYTFSDYIWAFWDTNMIQESGFPHFPICFQFWFIRDLMVMVLCSPVIWYIVKKLRLFGVSIIGLAWLFFSEHIIPGFSLGAIFFFTLGAYAGVNNINTISKVSPYWKQLLISYIIASLAVLVVNESLLYRYLQNIDILLGITAVIAVSTHLVNNRRCRTNKTLSSGSFFVYAYHGMFMALCIKVAVKVLQPHSEIMLIAIYITMPLIVAAVGLSIYKLMYRLLPRTAALITGGR